MEHNSQTPALDTFEETVAFIDRNYSTINSLNDIAQGLHMSKSYLCRLFERKTGSTIMYYVHSLRMQAVETYVREGFHITAAAYMAGYQNYSIFYKHFQKRYQMAPTLYFQELLAAPQKEAHAEEAADERQNQP